MPCTKQTGFSPKTPIPTVSLSHPHLLPLLLPFSLIPLPEGQAFSLSLCSPRHLMSCPALAPSPSLVSPKPQGAALPPRLPCGSAAPAMLLLLLQGTVAEPGSRRDGGGHQSAQVFRGLELGGQGAPITHAHTCSKANLYLPLQLSRWRNVRTHRKAANRTAGGSPPGQAEQAGAGARYKPSTCTPHLAAGSGEHTSGLCARLVSPHLLQVKSTGERRGAKPLLALPLQRGEAHLLLRQSGRVQSLAGRASPTGMVPRSPSSGGPVSTMARWKDVSGGDATTA